MDLIRFRLLPQLPSGYTTNVGVGGPEATTASSGGRQTAPGGLGKGLAESGRMRFAARLFASDRPELRPLGQVNKCKRFGRASRGTGLVVEL